MLSLALLRGDEVLHFYETVETRDQGNLLLGHIQSGLKKSGLGFEDLDVLAVTTGPGSFTGIRIGLATMRGLALAAEKPLMGFSTFDLFATRVPNEVNLVAVESLRDELYFAVMDEEGHPLISCSNETPEVLAHRLRTELPEGLPLRLSGDAAAALVPLFPRAVLADKEANAINLAHLALSRYEPGMTLQPPTPYYLRAADVTISPKKPRTVSS